MSMAMALLPAGACYLIAPGREGVAMLLVCAALQRGERALGRGRRGMLMHLLLIAATLATLQYLLPHPWLFALFTTLLAMLCSALSCYGEAWRTLASWVFIPALYIAYGPGSPAPLSLALLILPLAGPFLLLSTGKPIDTKQVARPMADILYPCVGLGGAVLICSLWVGYHRPPHGQWIIWSAMSVSLMETGEIYRKLKARILGAMAGGGVGLALVSLHPAHYVATLGSILIPLTLAMRPYGLAFASRCLLIALSIEAFRGSEAVVMARVLEVAAGGILGATCTHLGLYLHRRRH
ncbi:FUSC family protein [Aeromonas schubertii]|nr:FUSC family protein [Aeromonas schubertii]